MQLMAAYNVILLEVIIQAPRRNVFLVISQTTMALRILTIIPLVFRQVVKIAILPTLDGNRLNIKNMMRNPFQSIQASTMAHGTVVVNATPTRPVMYSSPVLIAMITTNLP